MKRRLLNLLTALSLLLCVAVGVLWVRSYWATDVICYQVLHGKQYDYHPTETELRTGRGRLSVRTSRPPRWIAYRPDSPWSVGTSRPLAISISGTDTLWTRLGFGLDNHWSATEGIGPWLRVVVPFWLPAALCAVLPALRLMRSYVLRRRIRSAGECPFCGYDLRATPDRCPECGTIAAAPPAA